MTKVVIDSRDPPAISSTALQNREGIAVNGLRAVVLALPFAVSSNLLAPYDAPQTWWLQAIVIVTALAAVLRRVQQDGPVDGASDRSMTVVRWMVAAYAGWWVLTTFVSVAPGESLLGTFTRGFGLLTVLAGLALFPLAQTECRTGEIAQSLIDAALLGSAAVCLLGIGQAFGLDGVPGTVDVATRSLRVRATLGQHVFLGGYLVLVIPLAAARFISVDAGQRVAYRTLTLATIWIAGVPLL